MGMLLGGSKWLEDEDDYEPLGMAIGSAMKEDIKRERERDSWDAPPIFRPIHDDD